MNCKKTAIAAAAILSLFSLQYCGSDTSSSATGYSVGLDNSISQLTTVPPVESFTTSGLTPAFDTALASSKTRRHASLVIKSAASNLGFAVGEYHPNGQLQYKMISIFTINSASYNVDGKFVLPVADHPSITYTLADGSSTLLVSEKKGLAPTRFTAAGTALSATVTLTAAATSTTPATYSVTFSPALAPAFTGASCTLSGITLSTGITI